jgi:hypothetical protein
MRKSEGKRRLGRSRCRWENNIKMDLKEIGLEYGVDSSGSGQGPLSGICEHANKSMQ